MRPRVITAALVCAALGSAGIASSASPRKLPRVTLISDSVAVSIWSDPGAKAILMRGVDLFFELGEGRRLGGAATPGEVSPPTALQLIHMRGPALGPTVIMAVGYNDLASQYAANMEAAIAELHAAGVEHILWPTLRVSPQHLSNAAINAAIREVAPNHTDVTVLDWNAYASDHPEWFQSDGVHLRGDGGRAYARFLHASLAQLKR